MFIFLLNICFVPLCRIEDISAFKQVLEHPAFKENPTATIAEHLRNKLKQEEEMDTWGTTRARLKGILGTNAASGLDPNGSLGCKNSGLYYKSAASGPDLCSSPEVYRLNGFLGNFEASKSDNNSSLEVLTLAVAWNIF